VDEQSLMTPGEFAKSIKDKYPVYANIGDDELVNKVLEKYPVYKDKISFPYQPPSTLGGGVAPESNPKSLDQAMLQDMANKRAQYAQGPYQAKLKELSTRYQTDTGVTPEEAETMAKSEAAKYADVEADKRLWNEVWAGRDASAFETFKNQIATAAGGLKGLIPMAKKTTRTISPEEAFIATTPENIKDNPESLVGKHPVLTRIVSGTESARKFAIQSIPYVAAGSLVGFGGAVTTAAKVVQGAGTMGLGEFYNQVADPERKIDPKELLEQTAIGALFPGVSALPIVGQKAIAEATTKAAKMALAGGQVLTLGGIAAGIDAIAKQGKPDITNAATLMLMHGVGIAPDVKAFMREKAAEPVVEPAPKPEITKPVTEEPITQKPEPTTTPVPATPEPVAIESPKQQEVAPSPIAAELPKEPETVPIVPETPAAPIPEEPPIEKRKIAPNRPLPLGEEPIRTENMDLTPEEQAAKSRAGEEDFSHLFDKPMQKGEEALEKSREERKRADYDKGMGEIESSNAKEKIDLENFFQETRKRFNLGKGYAEKGPEFGYDKKGIYTDPFAVKVSYESTVPVGAKNAPVEQQVVDRISGNILQQYFHDNNTPVSIRIGDTPAGKDGFIEIHPDGSGVITISKNIGPGRLRDVLVHEMVGHFGMFRLIRSEPHLYHGLRSEFEKSFGSYQDALAGKVTPNYDNSIFHTLKDDYAEKKAQVGEDNANVWLMDEWLAYKLQARDHGIVTQNTNKIVGFVKAFWNRVLIKLGIKPGPSTIDQLMNQAVAKLRSRELAKREPTPIENAAFGEPAPAYASTPETSKEPTSIKNAVVDEERTKRGVSPRAEVVKRSFPDLWEETEKTAEADPEAGSRLVGVLKNSIRPISDKEDALLLHEQVRRQNEHDAAIDAKVNATTPEANVDADIRLARAKDALYDIYDVGQRAGTETARGLNARRLLAQEDYSLARMEYEKRAANDGKPLTPDEQAKVAQQAAEIERLQKLLDKRESGAETRQATTESAGAAEGVASLVNKARIKKTQEKSIEDIKAKFDDHVKQHGDDFSTVSANWLSDLARYHIQKGADTVEKLIPAMMGDLKPLFPSLEERDIRVALSNYGKMTRPNPAPLEAKLRDLKAQSRLISAYEDAEKGQPPLRTGPQRDKPTDKQRELQQKLNAIIKENGLKVTDPEKQMASALQALKTRLRNRTVDLERRLRLGDFSPQTRRKVVDDAESFRLRTELEKVKDKWESELIKDRLAKRSTTEKVVNKIVGLARAFKLTAFTVLGKLSTAAVLRGAQNIVEEGIGTAISRVAPGLASKAARHGEINIKAEAKSITQAFTQGMKDAWDVLKSGKGNLDLASGKHLSLPWEWMGIFGQFHGALKAPVKRSEFARSFEKRVAWNIKNGIDVTDPVVHIKIATEAYKDANRSIFMNDNWVTDFYKTSINFFERSTAYPIAGKAVTNAARFLLPIVKVPTNIVAETITLNPLYTATKLAMALKKGIGNLNPDEADILMRELKKGAIGSFLLAYGYFHPNEFGGYYQKGDKRKTSDVKAGHVRLAGIDLPVWATHAPAWEALQIGATIRRVKEQKVKGKEKGIAEGLWAANLGLLEEVPFVDQPMRMVHAVASSKERSKYIGEILKGTFVPGGVSQSAKWADTDAYGNPIQRKPETVLQHVEAGIPGLRENVPKRNKFSIRGQ
jgi:hypothetical protein